MTFAPSFDGIKLIIINSALALGYFYVKKPASHMLLEYCQIMIIFPIFNNIFAQIASGLFQKIIFYEMLNIKPFNPIKHGKAFGNIFLQIKWKLTSIAKKTPKLP